MKQISHTRVTLALDIVRKIAEGPQKGYHELGIVKHLISLGDTISVKASKKMSLTCSFPGVPEDQSNICWQAAELLQKRYNITEDVSIDIEKQIPVQGGLAGGSTNAATTLAILDKHWGLGLSKEELQGLGKELGMDVPFYFSGGTAFDSEATSVLRVIANRMKLHLVLVVPPFGVSTADAYGGIDYSQIGKSQEMTANLEKGLLAGDLEIVAENMHNDFELSVFGVHSQLADFKSSMISEGALNVIMSGSGSTMIGLAENKVSAEKIARKYEKSFVVESVL